MTPGAGAVDHVNRRRQYNPLLVGSYHTRALVPRHECPWSSCHCPPTAKLSADHGVVGASSAGRSMPRLLAPSIGSNRSEGYDGKADRDGSYRRHEAPVRSGRRRRRGSGFSSGSWIKYFRCLANGIDQVFGQAALAQPSQRFLTGASTRRLDARAVGQNTSQKPDHSLGMVHAQPTQKFFTSIAAAGDTSAIISSLDVSSPRGSVQNHFHKIAIDLVWRTLGTAGAARIARFEQASMTRLPRIDSQRSCTCQRLFIPCLSG
jgi:hypothetical protein